MPRGEQIAKPAERGTRLAGLFLGGWATKRTALWSLGLTLLVVISTLLAQDSGPANEVQAIRALEQRYITAFSAKDVKTIMTCFIPDESLLVFDLVPPREYRGAAAFTKDWQEFLAAFPGPIQVQMTDLSVTADGKVGFGHRIDHLTLTDKGGKTTRMVVRVTHGYRKIDGKWLIVHEHASVPVDMASGKPVFESQP